MKVLLNLADKYKLMIHDFGKLSNKLNHPNIIKYRKPSPEEAINIVKQAHLGLVLEFRKAYTLSRLYFYVSMLQPIIAEGEGPWVKEAYHLGIKLYPLNAIEEVIKNYEQHIIEYAQVQKKLLIPYIHKPLLSLLQ